MSIKSLVLPIGFALSALFSSFADDHDHRNKGEMKKAFEESFQKSDSSNDNKLDIGEFKAFHTDLKQKMEAKKPSEEEKFKEIDKNNDGFVTKDEFKKHHKEEKAKWESKDDNDNTKPSKKKK